MKNGKLIISAIAVIITVLSVFAFFLVNDKADTSTEALKAGYQETPKTLIKVKPTPPPEFLKN